MRRKGRVVPWQAHFGVPAAPLDEPELELHPMIGVGERALVLVFLRRYVTWCARARRYRQMSGAADLYRRVVAG